MSYVKSQTFSGWIIDTETKDYISPKGRTASYPGHPFTGSVSEKELAYIKLVIDKGDEEPFRSEEEIGEDVANVEIVKSLRFGDVTVNFIKVR